jgi:hypothetical protein
MEKILTLSDIPRVKAGMVHSEKGTSTIPDSERASLARRAVDLLGYHALNLDVRGEKKISVLSGPLTEALLKLEIETLDVRHVIDYQMEEITRRTKEHIHSHFRDWVVGWFSAASWGKTKLDSYDMPIPEFVIDKALRIKEVVPSVEFYVQHLSDPKADPFLVAVLGKEIYYVEAWDEPRFEGREVSDGF